MPRLQRRTTMIEPHVTIRRARFEHDHDRIELRWGDFDGRDEVARIVTGWPGWRRIPAASGPTSLYTAPNWAHCWIPLAKATWPLRFSHEAQQASMDAHHPKFVVRDLNSRLTRHREPRDFQAEALVRLRAMAYRGIVADQMGLGKTSTGIWAWMDSPASRLTVVCPASVKLNWRREVWAITGEEMPVYLISGTPKQRANEWAGARHCLEQNEEGVVVINYDLLRHLSEQHKQVMQQWTDGQFLICDESHYLKNRKAKRTKFVLEQLRPHGVLALSGTPIRNTAEDLYSQMELVRPGSFTSYHDFCNRYLIMAPLQMPHMRRPTQVVRGVKNQDELNAVLNTMQIRRKKEDVLDLPPKIRTVTELEMSPTFTKLYKAMREYAVLKLDELGADTDVFAPEARSALEAALRCEQIAQGCVGGIPEEMQHRLGDEIRKHAEGVPGRPHELVFPGAPKMEWLKETVESIIGQGGQPIVFSKWTAQVLWLTANYQGATNLYGDKTAEQRQESIDLFQDGERPIMFCQVKIAEGFNLTKSQDVIFMGRDWSPAINEQAEDRAHRMGQRGTVNVQIPIMRGTIEEMIHKRLAAKASDAEGALRAITIGELRDAL